MSRAMIEQGQDQAPASRLDSSISDGTTNTPKTLRSSLSKGGSSLEFRRASTRVRFVNIATFGMG